MTQAETIGSFMLGLTFVVTLTVGILAILRYSQEKYKQSEERTEAQINAFHQVVTELRIVVGKMGENFENQITLLTKFDQQLNKVVADQNEMKVNCARQGHYKKVRNET